MAGADNGDQGDEEEDGGQSQQVQEVTHQRRPQLLAAADTPALVLLEHLENIFRYIKNIYMHLSTCYGYAE